jgi:hypothetical protein
MAALEERTNGWPLALNGLSHTVSHPNWPGMKRKPGGPSGCITSVWVIAWFLAHLCDAVRAAGNALCFKQILNQLRVLRIIFDR